MSFSTLARRRGAGAFGYLLLPGIASNYANAPDSDALSITGDIDIRVKIAMTDWTPSTNSALVYKFGAVAHQAYRFYLQTDGKLILSVSTDGTATTAGQSSAATGVADGATKWLRVTRASATGTIKFYTSDDGASWSQLGTDRAATAGAIYNGDTPVGLGATDTGTLPCNGKLYRVQICNNILDNGSGIVFDANFINTGRTFIEPASGATVTVSGASARASIYP